MAKYTYFYVIQGYYAGRWEDLSHYDKKEYKRKEVVKDFHEYLFCDSAPKRIIERKEQNQ